MLQAFGYVTVAMFGYMTDIQYVDEDPECSQEVTAQVSASLVHTWHVTWLWLFVGLALAC